MAKYTKEVPKSGCRCRILFIFSYNSEYWNGYGDVASYRIAPAFFKLRGKFYDI